MFDPDDEPPRSTFRYFAEAFSGFTYWMVMGGAFAMGMTLYRIMLDAGKWLGFQLLIMVGGA